MLASYEAAEGGKSKKPALKKKEDGQHKSTRVGGGGFTVAWLFRPSSVALIYRTEYAIKYF